jgi:hypothetical protein
MAQDDQGSGRRGRRTWGSTSSGHLLALDTMMPFSMDTLSEGRPAMVHARTCQWHKQGSNAAFRHSSSSPGCATPASWLIGTPDGAV